MVEPGMTKSAGRIFDLHNLSIDGPAGSRQQWKHGEHPGAREGAAKGAGDIGAAVLGIGDPPRGARRYRLPTC
jgi:hypothetical protein